MTIFIEIAKQCLGAEVVNICDASLAADQSYVNGTLSFFGYGRNTDLSSAKRQLLGELLKQINSSFDGEKTDAQCVVVLHRFITVCRQSIAVKSSEYHYDDGAVGPALQGLSALLQTIFDKLGELGLLDIQHDADPCNAFRYYIADYFANKIIRAYKTGGFGRLLENPQISITRTLSAEKEGIIVKRLKECDARLRDLNAYGSNYQQARIRLVLDEIGKLQRENLGVYTHHGLKPGMPVRLGFLGVAALPVSQPAGGTLDEALRRATAEITRTMESMESTKEPALNV